MLAHSPVAQSVLLLVLQIYVEPTQRILDVYIYVSWGAAHTQTRAHMAQMEAKLMNSVCSPSADIFYSQASVCLSVCLSANPRPLCLVENTLQE